MILDVTLVIAVIGLALSGWATYVNHFQGARIELIPGAFLNLYPAPAQTPDGLVWGGYGIYLPVTFHNWSAAGGVVHEVRLILVPKSDPTVSYDMTWAEFAEHHSEERRLVTKSTAQPLAVPGKTSVHELVQFQWPPQGPTLRLEEGPYDVLLLAWRKKTRRPQIVFRHSTRLSSEQIQALRLSRERELPMTIGIPLGATAQAQVVRGQHELEHYYSLGHRT